MAFWGNSDGAKLFGRIISRVTLHRMVSAKNMTGPEGALKRSKLKTISHGFRRSWEPCTEFHGMSRGDIGWYIKGFHDLNGHKNSFYDRFGAISWLHLKIKWWFDGILEPFR